MLRLQTPPPLVLTVGVKLQLQVCQLALMMWLLGSEPLLQQAAFTLVIVSKWWPDDMFNGGDELTRFRNFISTLPIKWWLAGGGFVWQQTKQDITHIPCHGNIFQLLLGDPKVFPGWMRDGCTPPGVLLSVGPGREAPAEDASWLGLLR